MMMIFLFTLSNVLLKSTKCKACFHIELLKNLELDTCSIIFILYNYFTSLMLFSFKNHHFCFLRTDIILNILFTFSKICTIFCKLSSDEETLSKDIRGLLERYLVDFNEARLHEANLNLHMHVWFFPANSIIDGKQHLSEVVFSALVEFSL